MAMPNRTGDWTVSMLDAMPEDGQRYEIIDGTLYVTPAPRIRHQDAVTQLVGLLLPYVAAVGEARVLVAPTDVRRGERTSVQPDLLVVRLDDRGRVAAPMEVRDLHLAIEVLSERSARTDRQDKRSLYQREGVSEYWIVDTDAWVIERWRPGESRPEILTDRIEWRYRDAAESLEIDVRSFFASLLPED
jgi:Uma2 family endonuclease